MAQHQKRSQETPPNPLTPFHPPLPKGESGGSKEGAVAKPGGVETRASHFHATSLVVSTLVLL